MNKALKALKEANPKLFGQFMGLLTEDLGISSINSSSGSLTCPNCLAQFQVALSEMESVRVAGSRSRKVQPRKYARKWKPKPNSLFMLLVKVARIRRTTTGNVSAEFNKAMRSRIKGLPPKEIRKIKIVWLNEQIAKGKSKNKAAWPGLRSFLFLNSL